MTPGGLHDIKARPAEALSKLTKVLWEVGHCHSALPVERLHVVHQEQGTDTSCSTCTAKSNTASNTILPLPIPLAH